MINDLYKKTLIELLTEGQETNPRGIPCRELLCHRIVLPNIDNNVITIPGFETNLNYAQQELNWYLNGDGRIDFNPLIQKVWTRYSDDGKTVNSNYGERIFGRHRRIKTNQWQKVIDELKKDPDSRRALLNINSWFDKDNPESKDIPCTIAIQAMIRNSRLNWITYMRSNDIVKGFRNDVYCFTEMQKLMAKELNIPTGEYYHIAGSMHLYHTDYEKVKRLMEKKE